MSFGQPYPKYKDSGVEWLGEVPEHWTVAAVRRFFLTNPTKNEIGPYDPGSEVSFLPMEAIGEQGELDLSNVRPISEVDAGYTYFADGDVLIAKITPCFENGKGAVAKGLVSGFGFGTTEVIVLRPIKEISNQFAYWLFASAAFRLYAADHMVGSAGQKRVQDGWLKAQNIAVPLNAEQGAIVDYLDRATTRIDTLIAKKTRFIELLREKRQALIMRAVTKGLDDNVPMKDSGVEWLGEVPEHWEIAMLKRLVIFQRGHDLPEDQRRDGSIPIVSSAGFSGCHNIASSKAPGIVTGRYGSIGQFTFVEQDYWPLNTALYSIEFYNNYPRFVWYALQNLSDLFISTSIKSAVPGIDRNDIHKILIGIPPESEQIKISDSLDTGVAYIDTLITKTQQSIALLQEKRSALITAAVTGKIDLRQAA